MKNMAVSPDLEQGWESSLQTHYMVLSQRHIPEPETWKQTKSRRLFLKVKKEANVIFRTFEFSQTVLEHHENLPSFQCQRGKN